LGLQPFIELGGELLERASLDGLDEPPFLVGELEGE